MSLLQEILQYNEHFVTNHTYQQFETSKFPDKKLVVISCMDTRLTELLPQAMNLNNGDAKFVKIAGAIVGHPFGSVMRSVMVSIYELGAQEVCVIGHYGCGMENIDPDRTIERMIDRGVALETFDTLAGGGINLRDWLTGFPDVRDNVIQSVQRIKRHPLMPPTIPVHGLVIDPETGKLDVVVNGYENGA